MNVIFLDFDGVIDTHHKNDYKDCEERVKILAEICREYNCKVVISAGARKHISEKTLTSRVGWVREILELLIKYNIECIGRTKVIRKTDGYGRIYDMCKEAEIIDYLIRHPEISHFCVIDDETLDSAPDTGALKEYLVNTLYYSTNPAEEGILPSHSDEVGMVLKKKNKFKKEE